MGSHTEVVLIAIIIIHGVIVIRGILITAH